MFSSKINTQDLFYSNPVDRFLGNDGGLLNSVESGFSSSHGYSLKNSRDLPSTSSQDLFSQLPVQTIGETQESNMEYQKYISQNLLFGKNRSKEKCSFQNGTKEPNSKKNYLPSNENSEPNAMNEIKSIFIHLNENIKKLSVDTSDIQKSILSMEKELSKQNERISSYEEEFSNQKKTLKENEKHQKENFKRLEESMKKILNENAKAIKSSYDLFKNSIHVHQDKVLESMRRYSTTQANANKKTVEGMKNYQQQVIKKIDRQTDKVYSTVETCFKKGNDDIVRKFDDLKTSINEAKTFITEAMSSQKIGSLNSNHTASILSKPPNVQRTLLKLQNSTFGNPSFNGSVAKSEGKSFVHRKRPLSVTQSSVHTPIANIIKQKQNQQYSHTSSVTGNSKNTKQPLYVASHHESPYIQKQYSKVSINRKCTTPILKSQRIIQSKNLFKNNLRNMKEVRVTRNSNMHHNQNQEFKFVNADSSWPFRVHKSTVETSTINSSPYLTVYEAELAENYEFL